MLTKNDLSQIRKVIREEIEVETDSLKDELQADNKMSMMRIINETNEVKSKLKNIDIKVNKIQKNLKTTINFFDKEVIKVINKVDHIEERLHLPPIS